MVNSALIAELAGFERLYFVAIQNFCNAKMKTGLVRYAEHVLLHNKNRFAFLSLRDLLLCFTKAIFAVKAFALMLNSAPLLTLSNCIRSLIYIFSCMGFRLILLLLMKQLASETAGGLVRE